MKCYKIESSSGVGVYYITNFDKYDTYLYRFIHHKTDWQVAAPVWISRIDWSDKDDLEEISPLTLLVLFGEGPEEIIKRITGQK